MDAAPSPGGAEHADPLELGHGRVRPLIALGLAVGGAVGGLIRYTFWQSTVGGPLVDLFLGGPALVLWIAACLSLLLAPAACRLRVEAEPARGAVRTTLLVLGRARAQRLCPAAAVAYQRHAAGDAAHTVGLECFGPDGRRTALHHHESLLFGIEQLDLEGVPGRRIGDDTTPVHRRQPAAGPAAQAPDPHRTSTPPD